MSVLIKGMTMPRTCAVCEWSSYSHPKAWCGMAKKTTDLGIAKTGRAAFCPLVSVPTPHGGLIDKDELRREFMDSDLDHLQRDDWREVIQIVSDAPTIIEAEMEDVSSHIRQLAGQAGKILVDAALNAIKETERTENESEKVQELPTS